MNTERLKNWTIYQATKGWPQSPIECEENAERYAKATQEKQEIPLESGFDFASFKFPKEMDPSTKRKLDFFIKSFPKAAQMNSDDALAKIHIEKINALLARQILEELGIAGQGNNKLN
jgi:hypothetical protein